MSILSDPEGQDKIDATFTYNMLNGDTYDLRVTGLRSSVFGYRHNWASTLVETYTWLTGVTTAVTGDEQRMPLRYYPRVQVNQVAVIAEEQLNQFRARMATWHSQNYTVPLWQRQVILAVQALANQPVLTVDNVELGAKAGDQIMLTLGWDDYEILQVDSVTDTTVTLQSDLKSSWRVGSVVTLVVAGTSRSPVLVRGLTSTKAALDSITFDIAPEDIATFIPADSGRIGLYNNSPIMPLRPNWAEDIPEQYSKPMTKKVDYQASSPVYYDDMEIAQHQIDWAYLVGGKTNISLLREFLFYIEGRHRSFWQPTYTKDFKIAKLYEAGFSTLTVENNNYISELWGLAQYKHICVETHTGIYYREITNVSLDVDSKLVLTLDTPIAEEMDANTVRNISFLQKWRLNSDTITLIYSTDAVVTCSLSMITTVGT
ncbi:hypothetical protein ACRXCV_00450 (plasmid) [Halobacteriovorax sp. GFR7]|uniref:hypothetical protein n=1 Tax=unclassified Halobacteriovorax TaxID=2639665 RepID=UPI003D981837